MRDYSVTWQKILAQGFTSVNELLEFLSLPLELGSTVAEKQFKTRVPRGFAARMQPGNPQDPLLLQVLAVNKELQAVDNYIADPLAESSANPLQGLMHKYQGRVLLTLTGVCAVNCRYCFRRHFPYQDNNPGRNGWQEVLNYIRQDSTIFEVILSGGDPLLANDKILSDFIHQLESIGHIRTIRFHTRIPVVLPERINETLLSMLADTRLRKVMVLHCNHSQELDDNVQRVCAALRQTGCHLLNQTVLLKGINDDAETLANLSERLFSCGVLPYYLHVLDKVMGAAHFDLAEELACAIHLQLQRLLPGYLVPRLVREVPGKAHKLWLSEPKIE
ncbi:MULTISPECIES: EF-P beta-lysylation protein EpmB [Legionella]|uniref:L-lysine 2,3-aminomutase n=1 Tax=Legionella maceachernii TaxID=466 RepID=A0A0W0WGD0_9GAMM|nr:EF-P beta-lysylation protein EpmB [Legionella maceachernii]KTD31393.1 lysine aminomutase [Legionella maceachernii]SKA23405.1 L-lysine 2,3-aminomutase [Legionella maceachernii]SUQ35566.1 L-lysine 2,3-aminomutase [Legionella maceachernii]